MAATIPEALPVGTNPIRSFPNGITCVCAEHLFGMCDEFEWPNHRRRLAHPVIQCFSPPSHSMRSDSVSRRIQLLRVVVHQLFVHHGWSGSGQVMHEEGRRQRTDDAMTRSDTMYNLAVSFHSPSLAAAIARRSFEIECPF